MCMRFVFPTRSTTVHLSNLFLFDILIQIRSLKHLKRSFPLKKGKETAALENEIPVLIDRIRENTPLLLQRFVNLHGERIAMELLKLADYTEDGLLDESKDPDSLSTMVSTHTDIVARELSALFPSGGSDDPSKSMRRRSRDRDASFRLSSSSNVGGRPRSSSRERNLKRDMERLFTQKVQVYGNVKRNRSSPMCGVLKIVFKAYLEHIRSLRVLSLRGHKRVQEDVYGLKSDIPLFLPSDDVSSLEQLLDETLSSASDRCAKVIILIVCCIFVFSLWLFVACAACIA